MHVLFALLASVATTYAPPQFWANGFAAAPRIPLVGDVDNDGYADLVAIYPPGDSIIDVSLSFKGQRAGFPFQGLTNWGKDCQAAVAGPFDDQKGDDVLGLFDGKTLRLAGSFSGNKFQDAGTFAVLPKVVLNPEVVLDVRNNRIIVASKGSGSGYQIDLATKRVTAKKSQQKEAHPWFASTLTLPNTLALPAADVVRRFGDIDYDGDLDIVEFRYGTELHTGNQVLVYRAVSPGETDSDSDGLTNAEEKAISTDPLNSDTDNDSLLDGWEVGGFRGLDLKALGCDPRHIDIICLISRFESVKEEKCKAELNRAIKTYSELPTANPDGKTGFNLHLIYLDPVIGDDMNKGWGENRDKFLPAKWKGVVHWMQVTPGGGGQADQLGDGGSVSEGALWAVFIHEFGHQLGMDHEGFWPNNLCPIYTSLMNYAYSYWFEDDSKKIHYSDGALKSYVLRETDLDETIPLPYDRVKFLEKGPYRFRLKANGQTTLIDWNWNGVFGEKHVRADINYSYSTNSGRRDDAGKTQSAPWLFTHKKNAYVLYGVHDSPANRETDPSIGPDKPGRLMLKKLEKPFKWAEPWVLDFGGLIGDPVAVSYGNKIVAFYQTSQGVVMRKIDTNPADDSGPSVSIPMVVDQDSTLVPTVGLYNKSLYLFLTNPRDGMVTYKVMTLTGKFIKTFILDAGSTNPVGMCADTINGEAVIALGQDQGDKKSNRWQIRRYLSEKGKLIPTTMDWIDGEKGGSRGTGRLTVLFDPSKDAGPKGRIYLFGKGLTSKESPWSCTYVAHQVADKTVNGGWMVKRFYDEWTQTRSAPAAAWFGKDVIWAYRWVDGGQGASDNVLHVGYKALGIQDEPMGDHDDLTFFRTWGIKNSILYLGRE